ncbi:MAG: PLP-dependent transferase [Lachnospiraceae bacterium]|nr:PLP-dependent transferase [Lachnospiraceae bacterium]
MEHLYEKLTEYAKVTDYPYHMPGHKRRAFGALSPEILRMDITEIDGFDNLHEPEGILRSLQERAALLYGADESFCLVGGSTCGILSAVSAALPMGGHLLMSRNCHKSAYHAIYLRKLKVTYLMPPVMEEFGVFDAVAPEQVRDALEKDPSIGAVLLVSPTYEGRISDIRKIAETVHSYGKILIVDEAHGAHLGLGLTREPGCAGNSCRAGADLVIHSLHKTLPAPTQTALLHVNGSRVDRQLLRRYLRIYQSSSPSYLLMAGIDNALQMMEEDGDRLFVEFHRQFHQLLSELLHKCRHLRFLTAIPDVEKAADFVNSREQDIGKLSVFPAGCGMTGRQLYDRLRLQYHLQPEMASDSFCLLMFTVGDTKEGYQRLLDALIEIDSQAQEQGENSLKDIPRCGKELLTKLPAVDQMCREAWDLPGEEVPLTECCGRTSADFINLYPPGIPLLVPGERITKELLAAIEGYMEQEMNLQGVDQMHRTIRCLTEEAGRLQ